MWNGCNGGKPALPVTESDTEELRYKRPFQTSLTGTTQDEDIHAWLAAKQTGQRSNDTQTD